MKSKLSPLSKASLLSLPALAFSCLSQVQAAVVITEIHYDPAVDITGDANGDGVRGAQTDEFIEIVNNSFSMTVDISGWGLGDNDDLFFFPSGTTLAPRQALVLFGDYASGSFGEALVFDGDLIGGGGLSNTGEPVTLVDADLVIIDSYTYPSSDLNQSLTRDPDTLGAFVNHTTVAPGALFSPGFQADGSSFAIPEPSSLLLLGLTSLGLFARRTRQ